MTSSPVEAALGVPEERLREMASVDWHAGHPEAPPCGTVTYVELVSEGMTPGGPLRPQHYDCHCQTPLVLGDFAVRFITGQAQLSSTRDGNAAFVATVSAEDAPHMFHFGEADGEPLAGLIVRGSITDAPCDDPTCAAPGPHVGPSMAITGMSVIRHRRIDHDDLIVKLLGDHLAWLIQQRPDNAGGR